MMYRIMMLLMLFSKWENSNALRVSPREEQDKIRKEYRVMLVTRWQLSHYVKEEL